MKRIKMLLNYDGSSYHGFQWQENANTIQAEIERAIFRVSGEKLRIDAAGRTDAGVHALGQVVAFNTNCAVPPERWSLAINAYLPPDIHIQISEEAAPNFHPRFDAKKKRYFYQIYTGHSAIAFYRRYAYCADLVFDADKMHTAAQVLLGRHDFRGLCSAKSQVKSFKRTIYLSEVVRNGDWIRYTIEADGFLYNMVRIIVGALLGIGRGSFPTDTLQQVLVDFDRSKAGKTASPQGLFLEKIEY